MKQQRERLGALARRDASTTLAICRRRRLGDQHDMPGRGIAIEEIDRHQRGDAADLGREIAPAGADGMRDAAPGVGDQAGHLLDAGAGSADDADVAAAARRWRSASGTPAMMAVPQSGPMTKQLEIARSRA